MTIRLMIVDDQAILREGLATIFALEDDIEVVVEAADGEQAVARALDTRPDVVLMDLRMPVLDGSEATALILAHHPATAILVLTTFSDDESIVDALRAGAKGYLTKDTGRAELVAAVRAVPPVSGSSRPRSAMCWSVRCSMARRLRQVRFR